MDIILSYKLRMSTHSNFIILKKFLHELLSLEISDTERVQRLLIAIDLLDK